MAVQGSEGFWLSLPNRNENTVHPVGRLLKRLQISPVRFYHSLSFFFLFFWRFKDQRPRSRCQQILEDTGIDISGQPINTTASSNTVSPPSSTRPASTISSSRETYDNAYFYILFVMIFYSFLAMALFKCTGSDEENKDPYEEFIRTGQPSTQKFNTGHMVEKFYFEEESSL